MEQRDNTNAKSKSLLTIEQQLDFPAADLSPANTAIMKYILAHEQGLSAHAKQLEQHQRYVHTIADQALKASGINTRYAEEELQSFSHGFASLEIINDIVHPARAYNLAPARRAVERLFIDTRSLFEIEHEELLTAMREGRELQPVSHDKPDAEIRLANERQLWMQSHPNTNEVITGIGLAREESLAQLHARTIGAYIAHAMQLDE